MRALVLGEILWDVFDDGERLGGAPFNFAAQLARLGHEALLVSAVGEDERGRKALERAQELGVGKRYIRTTRWADTGVVEVQLNEAGQPQYQIRRPAAYDFAGLSPEDLAGLRSNPPDWIYYGSLFAREPRPKALLEKTFESLPEGERFFDVNLRPDSYTPELLLELLPYATVLKVNADEVWELERAAGDVHDGQESFARRAADRYGLRGVAITRAEDGCALFWEGEWVEAPGIAVKVHDAVGAGDAFSAALAHATSQGWPLATRAAFANRVGALIASKAGATPEWTEEEAWSLEA
ncbi:MAG: hypothetical protein GC160_08735 [Acidobacteria bacterium]|nr:hypothetical protein [Acidobacteriota bacterium]